MFIDQNVHKALGDLDHQNICMVFVQKLGIPLISGDHDGVVELLTYKVSHDVAEGVPVDDHIPVIPSGIFIEQESVYIIRDLLHALDRVSGKYIIRIGEQVTGSETHEHRKIAYLGESQAPLSFICGRDLYSQFS